MAYNPGTPLVKSGVFALTLFLAGCSGGSESGGSESGQNTTGNTQEQSNEGSTGNASSGSDTESGSEQIGTGTGTGSDTDGMDDSESGSDAGSGGGFLDGDSSGDTSDSSGDTSDSGGASSDDQSTVSDEDATNNDDEPGQTETSDLTRPAEPTIAFMPADYNMDNGSAKIDVAWDMWWGENGNHWELLVGDELVHEASITAATPSQQSGQATATITEAGVHQLRVRLCNKDGDAELCSSATKSISVDGGNVQGDVDASGWPKPLQENNKPYENTTGKVVASYFVEWGIYGRDYHVADMPAENLTHVLYGFIPICGPNDSLQQSNPSGYSVLQSQCEGKQDYEVVIHDKYAALEKSYPEDEWDDPIKGNFGQLQRLSKAHPDLKILPSVGGWTLSDPFFSMAQDPAKRKIFVDSMINFIKKYDFFDGVDIDWEFPGGRGANPELGGPEDADAYATLMQELRAALDELEAETGREYELTSAVGAGPEKIASVNYAEAQQYMDYVFAMTYDFYGSWSAELGHQAGLYQAQNAVHEDFDGHNAIQALMTAGVPANKLVLGVAMYGRGWNGIESGTVNNPFAGGDVATGNVGPIDGTWEDGVLDYRDIEDNMLGGMNGEGINGFEYFYDEIAEAPYLWNYQTGELVTYENARSTKAKMNYVQQHNLAGAFSWEIDADNGVILNAMHEGLGHPSSQ